MDLSKNCSHDTLTHLDKLGCPMDEGIYECSICGHKLVVTEDDCLARMSIGDILGWIVLGFLSGLILGTGF